MERNIVFFFFSLGPAFLGVWTRFPMRTVQTSLWLITEDVVGTLWAGASVPGPSLESLDCGVGGWVSLLYKKVFSLFAFIVCCFRKKLSGFLWKNYVVSRVLFCLCFCSNSWLWAGGNNRLVCNINELVFIAYMTCKAVPTGPPCQRLCTSAVLEIKYFGVCALSVFFLICWGWGGYHCYIRRRSHYLHLIEFAFLKRNYLEFRGRII